MLRVVLPAMIGLVNDFGVLGVGTAFPTRELGNVEAIRVTQVGESQRNPEQLAFAAQGLSQTIGVSKRRWAHDVGTALRHAEEETTLDLATRAARAAIEHAETNARDVKLVLVSTSTPHRMTSTLSAPLAASLGVRAACLDVRTGCSGGLFALATAALYANAGVHPILVVGTETFSKVVPPEHKMGVLSLADGAGALVVGKREGSALLAAALETDGNLGGLISTTGALPPTAEEIERGGYVLSGNPEGLAAELPQKYRAAIVAVLEKAGLGVEHVDRYVPHQTSVSLIHHVSADLGLDRARVWDRGVARHANIGAAGWFVALAEAMREGFVKRTERVLLAGVGGGMSWGAVLLRS